MRMTVPGEGMVFKFAPMFDRSNKFANFVEIQSMINARIQDGNGHRRNDAAMSVSILDPSIDHALDLHKICKLV